MITQVLGLCLEKISAYSENLNRVALSPSEKGYLREVDVINDFETFQSRLAEIKESSCLSEKQVLGSLEPMEREQFFSKEYEMLSKHIELKREDYWAIKDFALNHNLDIKVSDNNLELVNEKGRGVVSLDLKQKKGEVLIGEHYYHQAKNFYTNIQRGEFRLPGYEIQDTYNVFGPNSKLTDSVKEVELKNGERYRIPIVKTEGQYHGMLVRTYGVPDFSNHAIDNIRIKEDAVVREAPSHKIEATRTLAQRFVEGRYPSGVFTEQQQQELLEIANGKKAETISGLTPHHSGNAEMQYVPTELHKAVNHIGGSWLMNEKNYFKGFECHDTEQIRSNISSSQLDYISEVLPLKDTDLLVDRIDELNKRDGLPPKAIDSEPNVARLLEPIKSEISLLYLEAPQDAVQIEEISETMYHMKEIDYNEWKDMSFDKRVGALQQLENKVAEISHRPACEVCTKQLGNGHLGNYSQESNIITINSDYVSSDSEDAYSKVLDVLVHEGRHAYQYYNLHVREVHPCQGEVSNWYMNEMKYGYQDVKHFGFKAYEMQPVEADARAFSEDVLKSYMDKIA